VDFRGNFVIGKFIPARAGYRIAPLAAAIAMGFAGSAPAATILVNDASEAAGVPGKCTLVDAATAVNQASLVGSCTNTGGAFGSNDTIDLSTFVSPTTITFKGASVMTPSSGLALTKPATIKGNLDGSGRPLVTITRTNEAPLNVRLIDTTANLTLRGVRLFNGRAQPTGNGGAIQSGPGANLTLINSTVSLSFAVGSGGGIDAQAAVTLINSTVYGNTAAGAGGGIHVGASGSVTATGSTINANTTSGGSGGGINATTVSLTNSTISGNSAQVDGGGIYTQNATLNFCTIAANFVLASGIGAGLALGSQPTPILVATATLIYDNTPGDDVDSNVARTLTGDHDLVGVFSHNINVPAGTLSCDPKLDLLADNGGPTLTHALSVTSCAIDAGPTFPPGTLPSDQRGSHYARRVGNATDIGALETFLVPTNDRIFYDGFGL
jgi:predicted outer membrane repeat protein